MRPALLLFAALSACSSTDFLAKDYARGCVSRIVEKLGDGAKVFRVDIEAERLAVLAQNPEEPDRLQRWECRGRALDGPRPAQLPDSPLAEGLFPIADFDFSLVPDLIGRASFQMNQPVDHVEARYDTPSGHPRALYWILHGKHGFSPAYATPDGDEVWATSRVTRIRL